MSLSDCGHQLIFVEADLVSQHPEIVAAVHAVSSAPLILMLGTEQQCRRWGLDGVVVCTSDNRLPIIAEPLH